MISYRIIIAIPIILIAAILRKLGFDNKADKLHMFVDKKIFKSKVMSNDD